MIRLVAVLAVLMAACGDSGHEPNGPIADPAAFLDRVPLAECGYLARCGAIESVELCLLYRLQPRNEWYGVTSARLVDRRILGAVTAGTVRYSPEDAGACIDALETHSCMGSTRDPAVEVCGRAMVGTVADGDVPTYDFECESGQQSYDCAGLTCCTLPCRTVYLQRGETCMEGFESGCAPGLACRDATCTDPAAKGESCESTAVCAAGFTCEGERCVETRDEAGECTTYRLNDETVDYSYCEHIGYRCGDDLRCHPLRGPGDDCSLEEDLCAAGTACDYDRGTCMEPSAEGGPCFREGLWPICDTGLYCDVDAEYVGTCRQSVADGAPCPYGPSVGYGCASASCDRDTDLCGPPPTCP